MDQLTTTQSKSHFRPVNISAAGLPGGPLPVRSVAQNPTARPAIIRTVVDSEGNEQVAIARLLRQDEVSQPKPRMLPEQRLEKYVQKLRATKRSRPDASIDPSAVSKIQAAHPRSPIVTWSTPQASRAIDLSEAVLSEAVMAELDKSATKHYMHPAHATASPYLQDWPDEQEVAVEAKVEAQLEQATALDEQLRQLELRIEKLRAKEEGETNSAEQATREKEILANPNTGELVTAISTAIVSALQEKSEAEVLPKAKSVFEANGCDSTYPAQHFDEVAWRQLCMKTLFVESPLWRVVGVDERADSELARMALDLVDERRSASRNVYPELWMCMGTEPTERALSAIEQELSGADELSRKGAILALGRLGQEERLSEIEQDGGSLFGPVANWARLGRHGREAFAAISPPEGATPETF